jgi:hypothetical protein
MRSSADRPDSPNPSLASRPAGEPAPPNPSLASRPAGEPAPPPDGMWSSLRRSLTGARGYQRLAYVVGLVLMLTGLVHAVIWAVVGGSAEGPLSWRKPVTFGISFGLTTVTLAWVGGYLPVRRATGWTASVLLCASTTIEVAWVSLQHARGVPSHFNNATALDQGLFVLGGLAIAVTLLVVVAMAVVAFARTSAPPPLALAIRSGLLALLVAMAVGVWMILHGLTLVDAGADPATQSMSTYGGAGAMKDAHAIPMHAIQVFLVLAWLLRFSGLRERAQSWLVGLAVAAYAVLFAVILLRTASGLASFVLDSASTVAYLLTTAVLAATLLIAVAGAARHALARR